ncbi:MAG: alanyl-tRNA editing protein [Anaerolineae bacterium]|nr:alanyl-tRNA editing protein [Anaerolineae bacterium]
MTTPLYYQDAYLREFDAEVVGHAADGAVILDRTAFYPGGGGQPHDLGTLSAAGQTWPVERLKKDGPAILHYVQGDPPPVGTRVHGVLDWERRYALMRTHTALHCLCGTIWNVYGAQVTGGAMEPGQARMDFEFESMRQEFVREIEAKVNAEVAQARAVSSRSLPREEAFAIPDLIRTKINLLPAGISEVRVVEIDGLDLQADGGTHVANTREIGVIRIVGYESKGKINKRLRIALE